MLKPAIEAARMTTAVPTAAYSSELTKLSSSRYSCRTVVRF